MVGKINRCQKLRWVLYRLLGILEPKMNSSPEHFSDNLHAVGKSKTLWWWTVWVHTSPFNDERGLRRILPYSPRPLQLFFNLVRSAHKAFLVWFLLIILKYSLATPPFSPSSKTDQMCSSLYSTVSDWTSCLLMPSLACVLFSSICPPLWRELLYCIWIMFSFSIILTRLYLFIYF